MFSLQISLNRRRHYARRLVVQALYKCVVGKHFPPTSCNRKLIGACYFYTGYEATNDKMNSTLEYCFARDSDSNDTHTASIAAGRYVFRASTMGYAKVMAAETAPNPCLAVYKICWNADCYDFDILVAFDVVMADGVDVISLNVGGVVVPYHLDVIVVGAFGANEVSVFVSASVGNGNPSGLTRTNVVLVIYVSIMLLYYRAEWVFY
uniref:Subtilisin-like protease n=1 Tax=Cajanus cajan TaxID=3821 RepID=A0A151T463_CAJCA|nr:Subtilisin-like protease [Cajanus cajan]